MGCAPSVRVGCAGRHGEPEEDLGEGSGRHLLQALQTDVCPSLSTRPATRPPPDWAGVSSSQEHFGRHLESGIHSTPHIFTSKGGIARGVRGQGVQSSWAQGRRDFPHPEAALPARPGSGIWGCLAGPAARRCGPQTSTAGPSPCVTQEKQEAAPLLWIQGPGGCRRAGSARSSGGGAVLSWASGLHGTRPTRGACRRLRTAAAGKGASRLAPQTPTLRADGQLRVTRERRADESLMARPGLGRTQRDDGRALQGSGCRGHGGGAAGGAGGGSGTPQKGNHVAEEHPGAPKTFLPVSTPVTSGAQKGRVGAGRATPRDTGSWASTA